MRKTQKMKRTISLLLALVFALSLLPMTVIAAEIPATLELYGLAVDAKVENGNVKINPTVGYWQTILDRFMELDYTVSFRDDGGAATFATPYTHAPIAPGDTVGTLPAQVPIKDDHNFKGWTWTNGGTDYWDINTKVTYDKLQSANRVNTTDGALLADNAGRVLYLYASWEAVTPTVKVTFVPTMASGSTVNSGSPSNAAERFLLGAHSTMLTANKATWELEDDALAAAVKYGENGEQYFTRSYQSGAAAASYPKLELPGYTHLGWSKSNEVVNNGNAPIELADPSEVLNSGDFTLYAVWQRVESGRMTYKLESGSNAGTVNPRNDEVKTADGIKKYPADIGDIKTASDATDSTITSSGDFIRYNDWVVFTSKPAAGDKVEWFVNGHALANYTGSKYFTFSSHTETGFSSDFDSGKKGDKLAIRMPAVDTVVSVKYTKAIWSVKYELLGGKWQGNNFQATEEYPYTDGTPNVAVPGYNADGSTGGAAVATVPELTGYDFKGWLPFDWDGSAKLNIGITGQEFTQFKDVDTDLTLIAIWQPESDASSIVFLPDVLGSKQPGSSDVKFANAVKSAAAITTTVEETGLVAPTAEGYVFDTTKDDFTFYSWNGGGTRAVSTGTIDNWTSLKDDTFAATGDLTVHNSSAAPNAVILIPHWEADDVQITVDYGDNGYPPGTNDFDGSESHTGEVTIPADTYSHEDDFTDWLYDNGFGGGRLGYKQVGFSETPNGPAITRWPTSKERVNSILYALWEPVTINVSLSIRGIASGGNKGQVFADGTSGTAGNGIKTLHTFTMGELVEFNHVPTATLLEFSHWVVDTTNGDGSGTLVKVTSSLDSAFIAQLTGDGSDPDTVTLYAVFTPKKFKINYHLANIGATFTNNDTVPDAVGYYYYESGSLPLATSSLLNTPDGYKFIGWYTEPDLKTVATEAYARSRVNAGLPINVYARWDVDVNTHYKVTLKDGRNNFGTGNGTVFYQGVLAVSKNNGTLDINDANWTPENHHGADFMGWYTTIACDTKIDNVISVTADMDVYAKWERHFVVDMSSISGAVAFDAPRTLMRTTAASVSGPFDDMIVIYSGNDYTSHFNAENITARYNVTGTTQFRYIGEKFVHDFSSMKGDEALVGKVLSITLKGDVDMAANAPVFAVSQEFPDDFDENGLPVKEGKYSVLSLNIDKLVDTIPTLKIANETDQVVINGVTYTKKQLTTDRPSGMLNYVLQEGEDKTIEIFVKGATTADFTINVTNEATIIAPQFTIAAQVSDLGGGTVSGGGVVDAFGNITVTATPDGGYAFSHWTDDADTVVSYDAVFNVTNVIKNMVLTANFRERDPSEPGVTSFKVSFNPGSGEGTHDAVDVIEGGKYSISKSNWNAFTRDAYTLAWFEDAEGKRYGLGDEIAAVTANIELTAKYLRNKAPGALTAVQEDNTIRVKYNKLGHADGYQLAVSTSKDFTASTTGTAHKEGYKKNVIKTCKGEALKAGTTYYVRMRAYVNVNDSKVYGDWSPTKTVKFK